LKGFTPLFLFDYFLIFLSAALKRIMETEEWNSKSLPIPRSQMTDRLSFNLKLPQGQRSSTSRTLTESSSSLSLLAVKSLLGFAFDQE
jgi:hypothetical protein